MGRIAHCLLGLGLVFFCLSAGECQTSSNSSGKEHNHNGVTFQCFADDNETCLDLVVSFTVGVTIPDSSDTGTQAAIEIKSDATKAKTPHSYTWEGTCTSPTNEVPPMHCTGVPGTTIKVIAKDASSPLKSTYATFKLPEEPGTAYNFTPKE